MNTATAITIAALAALTPTVTCLIGIILSRQDVRDLRNEVTAFRGDLRNELNAFRNEIRSELNAFRGEMIAMRKDVHADLLLIHARVANVEGRQGT